MNPNTDKITYESLWKAIIRPPRDYYRDEELGPSMFDLNGRSYIRKDFEIIDFQGKLLKVSFIEPDIKDRPYDIMPCVIYIHANSSSRVEGINIKKYLLKNDINLCTFDFEGSGYSEGEYISLGYHEKHQVKNIVDFVEKYPGVGEIGLWGRSMGAATTLIYSSMDERIKAMVVDSPFSDFRRVAKEMCLQQVTVPGFLIEGAISIIGKSVYKKNKMKINEIKAIEAVKNCYIPVIFIHAKDDDIVKFQHSLDLFKNYAGQNKELKEVTGGHNGKRSSYLLDYVGRFFSNHLKSEFEDCNDNNIQNLKNEEDFKINFSKTTKGSDTFGYNNFDLNQRKKKTIYEEWGITNKKLSNQENIGINEKENIEYQNKNNIENSNKEEEKKIQEKQENNSIDLGNKGNIILESKINKNQNIIKESPINIIKNENSNENIYVNNNKNNNIEFKSNVELDKSEDTIKRKKTIYDDLNIRI